MRKSKSQMFMILGVLIVFSMLFPITSAFAAADPYPNKPIRLIIPFAPGGSNDIIGRLIAAKLTDHLGKQVVVENRSGGGSIVGTEVVAKSSPDGYTLLVISATFTTTAALGKLPYDPIKDFTPIAKLGTGPVILTVPDHPSVPAKTVKELIALLKQKPGQLSFACSGAGGINHMAGELFKIMTGTEFKTVQFKGGGPAMIDQLGGHSQLLFGSSMQAMPHIKSGKFRCLGTGGAKRISTLPNVPTISEIVPGYEATNLWGILAPAGTPAPVVDKLTKEIKSILELDEVKKILMRQGADPDYLDPSEFGSFIVREITKWTKVVKDANIKL